jgi:hypothetical protein
VAPQGTLLCNSFLSKLNIWLLYCKFVRKILNFVLFCRNDWEIVDQRFDTQSSKGSRNNADHFSMGPCLSLCHRHFSACSSVTTSQCTKTHFLIYHKNRKILTIIQDQIWQ